MFAEERQRFRQRLWRTLVERVKESRRRDGMGFGGHRAVGALGKWESTARFPPGTATVFLKPH